MYFQRKLNVEVSAIFRSSATKLTKSTIIIGPMWANTLWHKQNGHQSDMKIQAGTKVRPDQLRLLTSYQCKKKNDKASRKLITIALIFKLTLVKLHGQTPNGFGLRGLFSVEPREAIRVDLVQLLYLP